MLEEHKHHTHRFSHNLPAKESSFIKNTLYSFPAWRWAFMGGCREQAGKFTCCVIGQGTLTGHLTFMWKTGDPETSEIATLKRVQMFRPKHSDTICFLMNGG